MKKKNILITAPSLDAKQNVSGISSMVKMIIEYNSVAEYYLVFKVNLFNI